MTWGHPRAGAVGAALRTAFDSGDLELLGRLLHPEVRWGGAGDTPDTCHSRDEVLATYADLDARGVRAEVDEVVARDGAIVLGLEVTWPAGGAETGGDGESGGDGAAESGAGDNGGDEDVAVVAAEGKARRARTEADARASQPTRIYQVFQLERGLIVDIRGYPARSEALRAATAPVPRR